MAIKSVSWNCVCIRPLLINLITYVNVWVKTHLVCACQYFKKIILYILKFSLKTLALPWYSTHSLSIIILSYLLVIWQVNNGWFLPVFDDFFMEFINPHVLTKGQYSTTRPRQMCSYWQWQPYRPTAKLEPYIGAILPFMNLHHGR